MNIYEQLREVREKIDEIHVSLKPACGHIGERGQPGGCDDSQSLEEGCIEDCMHLLESIRYFLSPEAAAAREKERLNPTGVV